MQRTVESAETTEPVTIIKCEIDDESFNLPDGLDDIAGTMTLGIKTMTNNTFGNNTDGLDCVVCGDRATGKRKKENFFFKPGKIFSFDR